MSFTLSHHAQVEIARRGIPRQIVEEVLANPQQKVPELRLVPCRCFPPPFFFMTIFRHV